jgi:hypothetical protein
LEIEENNSSVDTRNAALDRRGHGCIIALLSAEAELGGVELELAEQDR